MSDVWRISKLELAVSVLNGSNSLPVVAIYMTDMALTEGTESFGKIMVHDVSMLYAEN